MAPVVEPRVRRPVEEEEALLVERQQALDGLGRAIPRRAHERRLGGAEPGHDRRARLEPGEFLLVYSDALTDLRMQDGEAMGWDRLCRIVAEIPRSGDPKVNFERIWDRLRTCVPWPLPDDLTIALIGRPLATEAES